MDHVYEENMEEEFVPNEEKGFEVNGSNKGGKSLYVCNICDKVVNCRVAFKRHQYTHTNEWPFTCGECGKGFAYEYILNKHFETHSNERINCAICKKLLKPKSMDTHLKWHKGIKPKRYMHVYTFTCSICSKTFNGKNNLEAHEASHSFEKNHSCDTCGKAFGSRKHLTMHRRWHVLKSIGIQKVKCKLCDKMLKPGSMSGHIMLHRGIQRSREMRFSCEICNRGFHAQSQLVMHKSKHTNEKNHVCDVCSKAYPTEIHLKMHLKYHGPRPYLCTLCDKHFPTERAVIAHQKVVHEQFKDFECSICQKRFGLKYLLSEHYQIHIKGAHHKCTKCDKRYKRKSNLQSHMVNNHSNDRDFFCAECSRAFATKTQLDLHVKKVHKPNEAGPRIDCEMCQRTFLSRAQFKTHLQSKEHELVFLSATGEEQERFLFS